MQVCRQWAGGAADGLRGHRCGAGAGAGLLLAGGAGGRGDLLRWWCAGVVIVRAARSSGRAVLLPIRQAGQECGRAGRWAKEKGQGRRRGVRCCSGLLSALAVRSAAPGASRCISCAAGVCSPFRCRSAGAGTDPGATVPAAPDPAARPAPAALHPVRFCPAAGGVRFSTLPGSALGVGLELSRL